MKKYLLMLTYCFAMQLVIQAQTITCSSPFILSDWQIIGPVSYPDRSAMGKVISIWADPSNINHLLAGTGSSGLWETFDQGDNWSTVLSTQFPALGVWDIAGTQIGSEYKWFLSTMFFSKQNIMNLGMIYFDVSDDTWKEAADYPDYADDKYDFKLGGAIKSLGFRQMYIRP
ncbi:MAG: hypothetical protein ACK4IY_08085, partial [Chitinophagales bacterium]